MGSGGGRSRVLVADDAAGLAERLCDALRDEIQGIEVIGPARDGVEALEQFGRTKPHVVVLDLQMPRLDGLNVLEAIRARDDQCVVVILTNHTEPAIRDQCLAQGANYFLRKSHDFELMVDIVRAALPRS